MSSQIFSPGDIVWVPGSSVMHSQSKSYWPAKFLKYTNRADICMVWLYGVRDKDEQFLVDTEEIVSFQKHSVEKGQPDLIRAYEAALIDHANRISTKVEHETISNSVQLCQFVQKVLLSELLSIDDPSMKSLIIPKLTCKDIPSAPSDLKIYFERRVPQMLSFLIDNSSSKSSTFMSFLKEMKSKINSLIISSLKDRRLSLRQK